MVNKFYQFMMANRHSDEENILYDLTVQAEWRQETEPSSRSTKDKNTSAVKGASGWSLLRAVGLAVSTSGAGLLPADLVKLLNIQISWKLSISTDGDLLAILQDGCIEIRSSQSEFTSVIGRWNLSNRDPNPQWRQLSWCFDNSMIAVSDSTGQIELCDARMGMPICHIPAASTPKRVSSADLSQAVSSIVFKELRANIHVTSSQNDQHWFAELLVITYQGNLVSYLVSREGDCRQSHVFSFAEHCPNGVYSMVYDSQRTVLIAGSCATKEPLGVSSGGDSSTAASYGITVWRILSDTPYYKLVTDYETELAQATRTSPLVKRIRSQWYNWSNEKSDGIYKLSLSPDCQLIVSIHLSGRITVWHVPSLRMKHTWTLDSQPGHNAVNGEIFANPKRLKAMKEYVNAYFITDVGWWSEEAIILVRGTGSVTVASVNTLENLLGVSPEWFEPSPSVTWASSGSFLGLECESKTVNPKRHILSDNGNDDNYIDSDDELEMTVMTRASLYVKKGLHYVTDIEKFQPPKKRTKLISRTYRLVCLKSTTPDELYARKIDNEEYGEALQLAKTYQLDCDLVYQRQWRKSRVSVASIQDYLSKIVKRSWVLHECMERVPEDFDAMNELLKYGLRGTDLEALAAIGRKQDNGRFILCNSEDIYSSLDVDCDDSASEALALQNQKKEELLKEINFSNLSLDQQELCRVRLKLLQYSDRLHTYEAILGGMHIACEKYDHKFFEKLRSQNIVELAVEYARVGDPDAVSCILTYHSAETAEHRLPIISNFPETCSPSQYGDLLPEVRRLQSGERIVEPVIIDSWRKHDWCEAPELQSVLRPFTTDLGSFLYDEKPDFVKFRGSVLSCEQVSEWYRERACEIELLSGKVEDALVLIKLAIEHQVEGLERLYDDMLTMDTLVYECSVDASFTFQRLQEMSNIERMRLMMSKSSEEMYLKNVRNWLVPFLKKCEKYDPGSYYALMREYLVTLAKDDLSFCLQIIKASKANVSNRIISDDKLLMSIALDCIYALTATDQLSNAWEVLECLPQKGFGIMDEESTLLHHRVDDLERHLEGAHILERNGLPHTVAFFRDTENSVDEAVKLFTKITRTATRKSPTLNERQLKPVLADICKLRDDVFRSVDKTTCSEIFVESLLCSGSVKNISVAGRMIECGNVAGLSSTGTSLKGKEAAPVDKDADVDIAIGRNKVSFERAVELVVSAAREYFDASATMDDPDMDLARACLNLITDSHTLIDEEKDLIESLRLLIGFGVTLLPVQVRMFSDRVQLIQKAIDTRTSTYKNYQRLLNLGRLLRVGGNSSKEMHGQVMRLVAQAAIKCNDCLTAHEACVRLMEAGYAPIWVECKAVAESIDFHDVMAKIDLLTFAVIHCKPEMLEDIVHAKSLLQMQVYYEHIHARCGHRDSPMSTDSLPLTSHSAVEKTRDVLSSTNRATRKVLSCMSNAKWWKKTLGNLHPTNHNEQQLEDDNDSSTRFTCLSCHPFYETSFTQCYCNKIEANYAAMMPMKTDFGGMTLNECILRASKIEDMMTDCSAFNAATATQVLQRLTEDVIGKDSGLGLAYLLALPNVSGGQILGLAYFFAGSNATDADECFEKLPQTDIVLKLATYYYAIRIANQLRVGPSFPIPCYLDDVYQMSAANLSSIVLSYIGRTAELPAGVKVMSDRMLYYYNRLTEYTQAQALQQLDRGINVSRFIVDEKYKMETILGLAMSLEAEVYAMALSLAKSYKVSVWEVHMTHLEFLFDESLLSTEDIEKRIAELGILSELKSGELTTSSLSFISRMHKNVYPLINGTDHERLLYYYTLLGDTVTDDDPITPQTHIRLLKKLKTAAAGIDYKLLTSGVCKPLDIIEPVLSQENVATIAKLASLIPNQKNGCLHQSNIYRIWYTKTFFQPQHHGKKSNDNLSDWLHRYDICGDILPKLISDDFLEVINSITFTPKAVAQIPVDCRRHILKSAMKFARQQQSSKKKGSDTSLSCLSWDEVSQQLHQSLNHLDRLNSPILRDFKNSEDPKLQSYAQRFDLSRSDKDKLHQLLLELIVDGLELSTIDELQKAAGVGEWSVRILVVDVLQLVIESLRDMEKTVKLFDVWVPIEALKTVCVLVMKHELERGKLAVKQDVFKSMEPFYASQLVETDARLEVMQVIEEILTLDENEKSLFLLYRTQAIVSTIDTDVKIDVHDVNADSTRQTLFDNLLERSSAPSQLISMCRLLFTWPPLESASDSSDSNPWCRLLEKLVNTSSADSLCEVLKTLKELHSKKSLPLTSTKYIANCLLGHSPPYLLVAAKCLLMSPYVECHDSSVDVIAQLSEGTEDNELFHLMLKCHMVPKAVKTSLYPPLVEFILSNQITDVDSVPYYLQVQTVVNQLLEDGYQIEAGSLFMQFKGTHRALRTFDASFSILTRLFH